MKPDQEDTLSVEIPGVIPDNRVIARLRSYADRSPLPEIAAGAAYVRGIVSGLDRQGVALLRAIAAGPTLKKIALVIAIYPGSHTWDDVLFDLLGLQDANSERIQFYVLPRRHGLDRPANLLWFQPEGGDHGHVVTGNVGNLMAAAKWEPPDAMLAFDLQPEANDALRKWFDGLLAHSRPLTVEIAAAPRLRVPDGDAEGERKWREYLALLDGAEEGGHPEVIVDPETGEIEREPDASPSPVATFPKPDPMLLAVQQALAKGSVVALNQTNRAPPLAAPMSADLFGERSETREGAAIRRQSFAIDVFDAVDARRLETRRGAMTTTLGSCSLMPRGGLRWVPEAASDLLDAEFAAVEKKAREALLAAMGGKSADEFIAGRLDKIAADCKRMAATIAPDRTPPPDLVERIKEDLTKRLRRNLDHGVTPGINRSQMQISLHEGQREGPWDLVVTFLASTASMPREIITDKFRMRGLVSPPEAMIRAFDLFDDALVGRHLARRRVDDEAKQELGLIKQIMEHPTASPKQQAHALFNLIKGSLVDAEAALTKEIPPA